MGEKERLISKTGYCEPVFTRERWSFDINMPVADKKSCRMSI